MGDLADKLFGKVDERPGNDRVRNSRRRARCHSDYCDSRVQAENSELMGRYFDQHGNSVAGGAIANQSGQSTVEFAVVTAGFLALSAALAALWKVFGDGVVVEHALAVASHHIQAVFPTTVADIFLY